MDKQKLLIADASPVICAALAELLGGEFTLQVCHNGRSAKELLHRFCPDIALIDLMLPELDGLSVLRSVQDAACQPAVVATTCFSSPYIEKALGALGVELLMMKPCDIHALAEHIHHISCKAEPAPLTMPKTVAGVLLSMKFMSKWKGFQFLEDAAVLYGKNPGQSVTKELYPAVAKLHDTNAQTVERSIRAAIQSAWEHRDETVWRQYLLNGDSGLLTRPTNTAFIAALAALEAPAEERAG